VSVEGGQDAHIEEISQSDGFSNEESASAENRVKYLELGQEFLQGRIPLGSLIRQVSQKRIQHLLVGRDKLAVQVAGKLHNQRLLQNRLSNKLGLLGGNIEGNGIALKNVTLGSLHSGNLSPGELCEKLGSLVGLAHFNSLELVFHIGILGSKSNFVVIRGVGDSVELLEWMNKLQKDGGTKVEAVIIIVTLAVVAVGL
jgi:hypothetical protein